MRTARQVSTGLEYCTPTVEKQYVQCLQSGLRLKRRAEICCIHPNPMELEQEQVMSQQQSQPDMKDGVMTPQKQHFVTVQVSRAGKNERSLNENHI